MAMTSGNFKEIVKPDYKGGRMSPLAKGKKNVGKNISKLMHEGRSQKQSIAIALSEAGLEKKYKENRSKAKKSHYKKD